MTDNNKKSAAIAAVMYYLNQEEAVLTQAAMSGMPQAPAASALEPATLYKPWGMSGRQAQMQLRNLMQLRTFQRNQNF